MKVRNIVRKAAVLGSSAALVGTTLMGALAYDLGTYPAKFIVNGQFDGKIVVGEKAATADVLGSIDIAASLQAASVSAVPVPGQSGVSSFVGDNVFDLSTTADAAELRESIGDVVDTVTENDLPGLKSGRISTSEGETDYDQYLRFKSGSNLQEMAVNYVENDDDVMADYFVVDTALPFIEWSIEFPEGLESEVDAAELQDIEDRSFNIMGTDFSIVKADITSGNTNLELTLMGGSVADTLREGETRTYSIGGVDYEVTLVFVSDPSTDGGANEAKFSVNGELTQALEEGDTDTLSGGLQIGVRDVLVNSREGVASFFLGADKVVFTDSTLSTQTFNGDVEINNENINDGDVAILGANVSTGSTFEITSIAYRLSMDAADGTIAYIPAGKGVKEFMKKPEALISDSLDVKYAGLTQPERTDIKIVGNSDDEYEMIFTNINGQEYTFPLVSTAATWKFGNEDDNLIFVESSSITQTHISREDYFIVSNDRGTDSDKSVTNVLRYEDYDDTDRTLELEDISSGNAVTVAISPTGAGNLVIGGHTYAVNVSSVSADAPNISVDLDGDGTFQTSDVIKLSAWGGVVVDLAYQVTANYNSSNNQSLLLAALVNGTTPGVEADGFNMSMTELAKNFDTSDAGAGFLHWNVDADGTEVDLDVASSGYTGPLANETAGASDATEFQFQSLEDDDDYTVGMTDFGVLIKEYDPSGSDEPNELHLSVPEEQVYAKFFVTLGSATLAQGSAGTSVQLNPIAVGLAVLDVNAPAVGSENLIVVGGPCANTVAAELLGNPAVCAEGFEPGKAVIQAWDKGDTVAILVAGYESMETQGASKVLASYEDYSLSGAEVEVVVADLNSISISPMS